MGPLLRVAKLPAQTETSIQAIDANLNVEVKSASILQRSPETIVEAVQLLQKRGIRIKMTHQALAALVDQIEVQRV